MTDNRFKINMEVKNVSVTLSPEAVEQVLDALQRDDAVAATDESWLTFLAAREAIRGHGDS